MENLHALREFNSMLQAPYPFSVLIEGNDSRFIDVGLLSRLPVASAASHRWVPDPARPNHFLFCRHLLSVKVLNQLREKHLITVWIAHLKSKFVDPRIKDPVKIAAKTEKNNEKRHREAQEIHDIIHGHHDIKNDPFVLCSDLNDHPGSAWLAPLFTQDIHMTDVLADAVNINYESPNDKNPHVRNPQDRPRNHNWTHRYRIARDPDKYERLDYLLVSKALRETVRNAWIQRRTDWAKTKAGSDHDPVAVDLDI